MAYQTGTSSDINDLLDKFRLFASSLGWSVNRWGTAGSGRELCISRSGAFFNFRSYANESALINGSADVKTGLSLNGSDGYDAGLAWDRQPGYPQRFTPGATDQAVVHFPLVTTVGPFPAYHFFSVDPKVVYAEVEIATGSFLRFGCGSLDLFNPAAEGGGRFCYATCGDHIIAATNNNNWPSLSVDSWDQLEFYPFRGNGSSAASGRGFGSMVRVNINSINNWAGSGGYLTDAAGLRLACSGGDSYNKQLSNLSPNPLNGVAILCPNVVGVYSGAYNYPVGTIPGMRHMDMTNYLPGDEFNFGGDTWKVFPWYQKGGLTLERGIAYKKVA